MGIATWVRSSLPRIAALAWFGSMLALGAGLLAKHVVALPVPVDTQRLSSSLAALRPAETRGQWLAVHVLYAECRCSQRIVPHLLSTTRPLGVQELVLWIGERSFDPGLEAHYRVKKVGPSELAQLGIEAAPLLLVLDPANRLRYAGGYSARKQGPVLEDVRIIDQARGTDSLASLPILGCAVSEELKRRLTVIPGL